MHGFSDYALTARKAAGILNVSTQTVINWVKNGKLTAGRSMGGHYRINFNEIRALVDFFDYGATEEESRLRYENPYTALVICSDDETGSALSLFARNWRPYGIDVVNSLFDAGALCVKNLVTVVIVDQTSIEIPLKTLLAKIGSYCRIIPKIIVICDRITTELRGLSSLQLTKPITGEVLTAALKKIWRYRDVERN